MFPVCRMRDARAVIAMFVQDICAAHMDSLQSAQSRAGQLNRLFPICELRRPAECRLLSTAFQGSKLKESGTGTAKFHSSVSGSGLDPGPGQCLEE